VSEVRNDIDAFDPDILMIESESAIDVILEEVEALRRGKERDL
jgi:predicted DNA-binding protein (UPF0251 family)